MSGALVKKHTAQFEGRIAHQYKAERVLCGYRKYPYPRQGRLSEILMERGILKAKFLKYMYEASLGFPEGCGIQTKKPSRLGGGGGIDIL